MFDYGHGEKNINGMLKPVRQDGGDKQEKRSSHRFPEAAGV